MMWCKIYKYTYEMDGYNCCHIVSLTYHIHKEPTSVCLCHAAGSRATLETEILALFKS